MYHPSIKFPKTWSSLFRELSAPRPWLGPPLCHSCHGLRKSTPGQPSIVTPYFTHIPYEHYKTCPVHLVGRSSPGSPECQSRESGNLGCFSSLLWLQHPEECLTQTSKYLLKYGSGRRDGTLLPSLTPPTCSLSLLGSSSLLSTLQHGHPATPPPALALCLSNNSPGIPAQSSLSFLSMSSPLV